jgi:hypothetical protein
MTIKRFKLLDRLATVGDISQVQKNAAIIMKRFVRLALYVLLTAFSVKAQQSMSLVWAKGMGGTGDDRGWCITVDTSGNVYTIGVFHEIADFDPELSTFNLTSAGICDIFVQKLNFSGSMAWAKRVGGTNWDEGYGIAVDNSGNVYTTGYFCDTVDFDSGPDSFNMISAGHGDIFVQKLNDAGNLVWAKRMGGKKFDFGYSIAVDTSGNVYTTGVFSSDTVDFDPGPGTFNLISAGWDIFVQKQDVDGNLVWAKRMGGASDDWGESITLDPSGAVYTTGYFQDTTDFDPGPSTYNLTSAGGFDVFVQKLDPAGNFVWAKNMGGPNNEEGYSIAVDSEGNVYTAGYFMGTADFDPGPDTFNLTSAGRWDIFIQKLDAAGNLVWAKRMGGQGDDWAYSLAVDATGNVYCAGGFQDTVDFDPGQDTFNLTSAGGNDIFIQKLDSDGKFVWAKKMGGPGNDYAHSIAIDATGNIYATGVFSGTANFDPGTDSVNLISAGDYDVFVLKLSQNLPIINNKKKLRPASFVCNGSSRILQYVLPERCFVRVRYYDMMGRLVATIVNQVQNPGDYSIVPPESQWATGVYVQVFEAGSFVKSEMVMVVH